MGEASKKSSSCEARNPSISGVADNSSTVRFGRTKWFKNGSPSEDKKSLFRLMALRKRGREGGVITLGPSRLDSSTVLILRV